jgi:hypothetical protein
MALLPFIYPITCDTDYFGGIDISMCLPECWQDYAINALQTVERLAGELGLADRLHLWPDKSLGNSSVANRMLRPAEYLAWLTKCW